MKLLEKLCLCPQKILKNSGRRLARLRLEYTQLLDDGWERKIRTIRKLAGEGLDHEPPDTIPDSGVQGTEGSTVEGQVRKDDPYSPS